MINYLVFTMAILRENHLLTRMNEIELSFCRRVNRVNSYKLIRYPFRIISRIGDGIAWYLLMLVFALFFGRIGLTAALHMSIVGMVTLIIYKILKQLTLRTRPCLLHDEVKMGIAPLDLYSFPSGHTMHAVAFTCVALFYFPGLFTTLIPFTILIALSRVILGLHYPSDVIAGAILGALIALVSFSI